MIAYNDLAPLAQKLRIYTKAFKEALLSFLEAKRGNSDVILAGVEKLDKADAVLKELETEEAAIATNARLSTVGKQEQMAGTAKRFHERLGFVAQAAKDRRNAASELQKKFTSAPKAVDNETVDYLRGAEIRQRLAKLPMAERTKILLQAMTTGNLHILRAVQTDPFAFAEADQLIEPEFLDRLQEQQAQKNEGKEWVRLQSLIFTAERLEQLGTVIDLQLSNFNTIPSFVGIETHKTDLAYTDQTAPPNKNKAVDKKPEHVGAFQ